MHIHDVYGMVYCNRYVWGTYVLVVQWLFMWYVVLVCEIRCIVILRVQGGHRRYDTVDTVWV